MRTSTTNRGFLFTPFLIAATVAIAVSEARADRIDEELLQRMPEVIAKCQEKGYKCVGVLTFLYQHGDEPSQFRGVAICNNMPQRVENALALKLNSKNPELLLLPQAAEAAAIALRGASYRTAADRQKLMNVRMAPAWGTSKAKPDAFIIGKVKTSEDRRKVTVSLGAFDRESMFDILAFDVKTDRYILADVGQGFSLTKGRVRGVTDDAIFDSVEQDIEQSAKETNDVASQAEFPVELTVFYDKQPQAIEVDSEAEGSNNQALPEPQVGQNLTFGLKNRTDKAVGVVLLVNGVSTLYEQEGEPKELNKWVLEPNKEYRVKGYHQQGNEKYFQITTLSEEESKERLEDLGGQKFAGLIHLYVFKTVDAELAEVPKYTRSIGRLSRAVRENGGRASLKELQQAVARDSNLFPPGTRPLAGWGKEMNETLEEKQLGTTMLTDTLIVRYSKSTP